MITWTYKLAVDGICRRCNQPYLEWEHQQGWRCKQCGYVYLIDKRRKCVLEPDCQQQKDLL